MSEMVGRVKSVLKIALAECDSEHASGMGVTDHEADKLARAAIEAMREPTKEMQLRILPFVVAPSDENTKRVCRELIDAALKEGNGDG